MAGAPGWRANPPLQAAIPDAPAQASMMQCLVLAALVHALLVAIVGNAPGGSARVGEGVWGAINVTLRGPAEPGMAAALPRNAYSGPVGEARDSRFGGAVRDEQQAPRSNDGPGAARVGVWSSTPSPGATEVAPGALAPPMPVPQADTSATPIEPAQVAPLARVVPSAPQVMAQPTPALPAATLAPEPKATPPAPTRAPSLSERLAPRSSESRPSDIPRAAPAQADARQAMVQSAPIATPAQAEPAATAPQTAAAEATPAVRTSAEPPVELKALPALAAPRATAAAASALPRESAARTEALVMPALNETPAAPLTLPEPVIKAVPSLAAAPPAAVVRQQALDAAPRAPSLAVPQLQAIPGVAAMAAPPGPVSSGAATTATAVTTSPEGARAATSSAPQSGLGNPDAGPRAGRDVATAPSAPASAPRLNLELARPRGGEIARDGSRGVLQLMPHPPERKNKLAEDIANAAKKDCKQAYAGAGLLAVVPLLLDATKSASASGCKW